MPLMAQPLTPRLLCLVLLLPLACRSVSPEGVACANPAGSSRARIREASALRYLEEENARRAPYYIEQARSLYDKALRQARGIDKSNNDPYIALYDGQHQVLGAVDLAPRNSSLWLAAGQVMTMLASLSEGGGAETDFALQLIARACELHYGSLEDAAAWASRQGDQEDERLGSAKAKLKKTLATWKREGVPAARLSDYLPALERRIDAEVCDSRPWLEPATLQEEPMEQDAGKQIESAIASMQVRPLFPTLITTVNVATFFGKPFLEKLAKLAIEKFTAFSAAAKKRGKTDANDINDQFFSAQETSERAMSSRGKKFWPELYGSQEYHQLLRFMKAALVGHASKTGYALAEDIVKDASLTLWAAVYLGDGGRHGYHVHQNSFSSCVLYVKVPAGKTPIVFIDPRGSPPTNDYEQHLGERDFEPTSPFHHNYHFFAEAGDLICFPSWLVHRVPSHFEKEPRVAFPANLQAGRSLDAWYRSATLP